MESVFASSVLSSLHIDYLPNCAPNKPFHSLSPTSVIRTQKMKSLLFMTFFLGSTTEATLSCYSCKGNTLDEVLTGCELNECMPSAIGCFSTKTRPLNSFERYTIKLFSGPLLNARDKWRDGLRSWLLRDVYFG